MKKDYIKPALKVDNAEATNIICASFNGNDSTGLTDGGGSNGDARAPESDWNIWGEE